MRFINCLILILFLSPDLFADHGIYFSSNEVNKENRTGVDITHNSNISYSNNFTIHFHISFRESETYYGEILSLKEVNKGNLLQVTYRSPDLFVIHNKRETKFHLNLENEKVLNNRWIDFELHIDAKNNKINLKFGDKILQSDLQFPNNSEFAMSLGVVNRYGFFIDEVPSISIKDLSIRIDDAPKHLWPFNKTDKTLLRDVLSSRTAKLYNPQWVIDYHNKWRKIKTLQFDDMPMIAFDQKEEMLNFASINGSLKKLNLKTKDLINIPKNSGFPILERAQQVIFDKNYQLTSYSFNKNSIAKYDPIKNQWENDIECIVDDNPKYWHHNKLIHPVNKQITTICGYGYYSYFNRIQSFNEKSKTWIDEKFTGDTISPRYLASFGFSKQNKNVGYLFGGLGNSMGKQILGKEFYYDLYKIDFKNKYIKRLWDYKCDNQFQRLPVNSMVLTQNDSAFYTLMFKSSKQQTYLQTVKGSIHKAELVMIGDSIPYNFLDIESFADLYYWNSENKLIALTLQRNKDKIYQVDIYTINYEPGNRELVDINGMNIPGSAKLYYILLLIVVIVLFLIFRTRYIKYKKLKFSEDTKYLLDESLELNDFTYQIPCSNSILLYGGFQVYDLKGKDITYRFSPTLKELFLLILFNSLNDAKGISSKRIQEYLWPDKPENKAKNNRGVNVKKLRGIVEDIKGVEIIFDNNYWKVIFPEDVFCDLEFVNKKIELYKTNKEHTDLETIVVILQRGILLRDIFTEWLDSYKDSNTGEIVSFLEKVIKDNNLDKHLALTVANLIFEFDQMNEAALKLKCYILSEQGKHSLAVETFEHYQKLYQKFYNENYPQSFKEIVSSN